MEQYRNGKENDQNLVSAIHQELERVKKIVPLYEEIGTSGEMALHFIKGDIGFAEEALRTADVAMMCQALSGLRTISD